MILAAITVAPGSRFLPLWAPLLVATRLLSDK
jgi:hypothetical protein